VNGAGFAGFVAAELFDLEAGGGGAQPIQEGLQRRGFEGGGGDDQIVAVEQQGDEVEAVSQGSSLQAEAHIGTRFGDSLGNGGMGGETLRVANNRAGVEAQGVQLGVQPDARAGAFVAVGEAQARAQQVGQALQAERVAFREDQPGAAVGQGDQGQALAGQQAAHKGGVVFAAFGIPQVAAGQIGVAFGEGDQPAQAAGELQAELIAGSDLGEVGGQPGEHQIVGAVETQGMRGGRLVAGGWFLRERAPAVHGHAQGGFDLVELVAGGKGFQQESLGFVDQGGAAQGQLTLQGRAIDDTRALPGAAGDQAGLGQLLVGALYGANGAVPLPGGLAHRGQAVAGLELAGKDLAAQGFSDLLVEVVGVHGISI